MKFTFMEGEAIDGQANRWKSYSAYEICAKNGSTIPHVATIINIIKNVEKRTYITKNDEK